MQKKVRRGLELKYILKKSRYNQVKVKKKVKNILSNRNNTQKVVQLNDILIIVFYYVNFI